MRKASITILVCLLSRVRRICDCLPAPAFEGQLLVVIINIDEPESLRRKNHYYRPLVDFSRVSRGR